eukprot:1440849-Prymnesium_polylepis.1
MCVWVDACACLGRLNCNQCRGVAVTAHLMTGEQLFGGGFCVARCAAARPHTPVAPRPPPRPLTRPCRCTR